MLIEPGNLMDQKARIVVVGVGGGDLDALDIDLEDLGHDLRDLGVQFSQFLTELLVRL